MAAARSARCWAVHPGYGFLSERPELVQAVEAAGLVFIGPSADTIRQMGSKVAARGLAAEAGVPVTPGGSVAEAEEVGFPLMLKASAGGGGKGMRVVSGPDDLEEAVASARRESLSAFGDDTLLVERFVERPRHVEVQILGDGEGGVVHVGLRECSIQRRHQKVIEETPSVAVDAALSHAVCEAAVRLGRALGYRSAGTVEFLLAQDGSFSFLEVNTRLQVEHPVTELVWGVDLVAAQLAIARGEGLPATQEELVASAPGGHAIEARLYAEDPDGGHLPQSGRLLDLHVPAAPGLRVDSGAEAGDLIGTDYDPMIAKIVTHGASRAEATRRLAAALERSSVLGLETNVRYLARILRHPAWAAGDLHTGFLEEHLASPESPREGAWERAAMIATLLALEGTAGRRPTLPSLPLGWRSLRFRDPDKRWTVGETTLTVGFRHHGGAAWSLTVGDRTHEVHVLRRAGPAWTVALDDRAATWRAVADERGVCWVHGPDGIVALAPLSPFPEGERSAASGSCLAPMPGKVLEVRVRAGDEVEQGASLVVLEAMKMEHTLPAPYAGRVEEVLARAGDQVEAEALLVVLVSVEVLGEEDADI